jgi:hypothetical protein
MADYDVGVVGLSVPAQSAPVTTYRPAVRVRNNGIHPANVTGTCRQYRREPPGDLLATWPLSLLNLAAGAEGDALAEGYWTPTAADIGHEYLFIADVTTEHDQVESNNHLAPVTVLVTAGVPPPPPPIAAHATQHEKGGADQVNVDDLSGKLADPQTPAGHKATHQAAGTDVLDVTGLVGILATPQPIADHHETHEDHGGDELNVDGLKGELADNQPAKVHDNAKHDPNYTTVTEFNNHLDDTTDVHDVATNLEHVANKGVASGYPDLNAQGYVPPEQLGQSPSGALLFLRNDSSWQPVTLLGNGTTDVIQISYPNAHACGVLPIPALALSPGAHLDWNADCYTTNPAEQSIRFIVEMKYDTAQEWLTILDTNTIVPGGTQMVSKLHVGFWYWHPSAGPYRYIAIADIIGDDPEAGTCFFHITSNGYCSIDSSLPHQLRVSVLPGDACTIHDARFSTKCTAGEPA